MLLVYFGDRPAGEIKGGFWIVLKGIWDLSILVTPSYSPTETRQER